MAAQVPRLAQEAGCVMPDKNVLNVLRVVIKPSHDLGIRTRLKSIQRLGCNSHIMGTAGFLLDCEVSVDVLVNAIDTYSGERGLFSVCAALKSRCV